MAVIPELIGTNYVYQSPTGMEYRGPEGFTQFITMMRNAFPDLHMTIVDAFGEGDRLSAQLGLRGTFNGDFGPLKANGKKFDVPIGMFFRFENGKETEAIEFINVLGFYQQLGINPVG
jgi:steroid delta-isomerase-like uncharacterized protein